MAELVYRPTKQRWSVVNPDGRTLERVRAALIRNARVRVDGFAPAQVVVSGRLTSQCALSIVTLPAWRRYNGAHRELRGRVWPYAIVQSDGCILVTESEGI